MAYTHETDLYGPIKRFLEGQGYAVKSEVVSCDVVGVRGAEPPVIVELKLSFCLQVLYQSIDRQRVADTVYAAVAVPDTPAGKRRWRTETPNMLEICRRLGLGLLAVHTSGRVDPLLDPGTHRPRRSAKRRAALLREFHRRSGDHNTGGSTRRPIVTAYREDALRCAAALAERGPLKVAALRAACGVEKAAAILQRDVYGWFARMERGVYAVNDAGRAALTTYADVLRAIQPHITPAGAPAPTGAPPPSA